MIQQYGCKSERNLGPCTHLWNGDSLDADFYLLPLVRYVHSLPVAAGLCASPADYAWSSDRAYRNGERIAWLAKSEVLEVLRQRDRDAARAYRSLMREPPNAHINALFERGSRLDSQIAGRPHECDQLRVLQ